MPDADATRSAIDDPAADLRPLAVYLNDHLAGAVAGSRRLRRTADALQRTPVFPALDRIATEVAAEREELRVLLATLGVVQARPKQVATWLGERMSRVKAGRADVRRSPMAALLEVELLRSAVTGKRGLWQTLADVGPQIGVDPVRCTELVAQTERQVADLDVVHRHVREHALREVRRPAA